MKRLLILVVLLLSSCVQLPPLPPISAKQLDSWRLNGRIAISTENDSWTAKVFWRQQGAAYQLRLNTPLGQGAIMLEGDDKGVVMRQADKKTIRAANPDILIAKVLKVELPVTNLHAWIRGLPAPNSSPQWYTLDNAKRHMHSLRQDGWEIDYKKYMKVQGIDLPKKIFLENNRFKVKIVISRWEIHTAPSKTAKPRIFYLKYGEPRLSI